MSALFTPGPWSVRQPARVLGTDARGQRYVHAKDKTIAAILDGTADDAQLIAASRELYAAAHAIEHALNPKSGVHQAYVLDENSPLRDALRDAIAKAEGRA
jgi:hypothetical protein